MKVHIHIMHLCGAVAVMVFVQILRRLMTAIVQYAQIHVEMVTTMYLWVMKVIILIMHCMNVQDVIVGTVPMKLVL